MILRGYPVEIAGIIAVRNIRTVLMVLWSMGRVVGAVVDLVVVDGGVVVGGEVGHGRRSYH